MTRGRIGVFGLVCALLSASPVTAQEAPTRARLEYEEKLRQWYYSTEARAIRVVYDPVRCKEYERTGGPIAGIVVGASFIGAGAGLATSSNGDKALLGGGIAVAVAGLASTIASAVVLAQRKKARHQQALAGCPVIAK